MIYSGNLSKGIQANISEANSYFWFIFKRMNLRHMNIDNTKNTTNFDKREI